MLSGNPLVSDGENGTTLLRMELRHVSQFYLCMCIGHELARYSRQFTIARIPSLIALDAASVRRYIMISLFLSKPMTTLLYTCFSDINEGTERLRTVLSVIRFSTWP